MKRCDPHCKLKINEKIYDYKILECIFPKWINCQFAYSYIALHLWENNLIKFQPLLYYVIFYMKKKIYIPPYIYIVHCRIFFF